MRALLLASLSLFAVANNGCDPEKARHYPVSESHANSVEVSGDWKVERQGYFHAGFEDRRRDILLLTSPTGKQFLCVTGCGVNEWNETVNNGDHQTTRAMEE